MAGRGDLDLGALREHLAASRRRGEPFEHAWAAACEVLVPDESDWTTVAALRATRTAWADAYERRPPRREHAVVAALTVDYFSAVNESDEHRVLG